MSRSTAVRSLNDVELHNAVIDMQKQIDMMNAQHSELIAEWDARKLWASDDSKSAAGRLARETGLSNADAKHLVNRARRLISMPACARAFAQGSLSSSRVDLLVRVNRREVRKLFERDEEMLLANVSSLSFSDASRAVQYWSQCADEAGAEDRGQRLLEHRSASTARSFEGSVDLRALFDPLNGEIFVSEFERLERELFESDWAEARKVHGEDLRHEHLARSSSQRRADALVLMAKRSASNPDQARCPRPLISVLVDYKTFGRVCEMASGTVITPGQLVGHLGDSDIERIVFDGPSRVIDVSAKRSFEGALRRAIMVRDRHCQHESVCDVPAARCQIDHIEPYSHGGVTAQSNGRALCPGHNRAKGSGPP